MLLRRQLFVGAALTVTAAISAGLVHSQDAPVPNEGPQPRQVQKPQAVPQVQVQQSKQVQQPQQVQQADQQQGQTYRAKQIIGAKVAIQGDTAVGTVDDIVLDDHGNVDYLIVANSSGQLVTVPWDATAFNVEQKVATVQITPEQFKQVPTYTAQQYPVYSTPAYRTQVYKYYGLTPGQARRIIRRGAAIVTP